MAHQHQSPEGDSMKLHIKFPAWPALLGLLFIGLKLGNVIAWSWWWVLAPFWIPFAILAVVTAVGALIFAWVKVSK